MTRHTNSIWTTPTHIDPRLRIQTPNSRARDMLVIALDEPSAALGPTLAVERWCGAEFVSFEGLSAASGWPEAMGSKSYDLVVMVADSGGSSDQIDAIGSLAFQRATKVAAILVAADNGQSPASEAYLGNLRDWAHTLAIIEHPQMVAGLLHGLGG